MKKLNFSNWLGYKKGRYILYVYLYYLVSDITYHLFVAPFVEPWIRSWFK